MPLYELSLTLRILPRTELISSIKRSADKILQQGGMLRQFQYLGTTPLPLKLRAHSAWHREGTYFLIKFDAPSASIDLLKDEFKRDIDLIRAFVVRCEKPVSFQCTLEEELQPPAYRADVQKLIEEGRKHIGQTYKQNSPGFDYFPFQK
nr:EOG090X0IQO [Scapholeberis mucronata]